MSKKRSLRRLAKCPKCGIQYTEVGLKMHRGSRKCELNTKVRATRELVEETRARMLLNGKFTIQSPFALALQRRDGLVELTGLERVETKWTDAYAVQAELDEDEELRGEDCVSAEWWVYSWVARLYRSMRPEALVRSVNPIYPFLERLKAMEPAERDAAIQLTILRTTEV